MLILWEFIWEPAKKYVKEEVNKIKKKRKRIELILRAAKKNNRKSNAQNRLYSN
jgi:hypothetical protein